MQHNGYEIAPYRDDHFYGVVDLLPHLYGGRADLNAAYFRWKYYDNPSAESPLGIVALHGGRVVGFRGYWATKWHIPADGRRFTLLCSGDTCVHPAHRMKGLSVAMGREAMDRFAVNCPLFLNISAIRTSVPGYLKMGFTPLAPKTYLRRYNLLATVKNRLLLTAGQREVMTEQRIALGEFGDILVSDLPMPADMSAIITRQTRDGRKIMLLQDEDFFRWRFQNRRKRYIFYFHKDNCGITGYLVMCVHSESRQGHILDYSAADGAGLSAILRHIIRSRHVDIISVLSPCLGETARQVLMRLHFRERGLIHKRKERDGVWPFLVRPLRKDCRESDWFIHGIDTRRIENWEIKDVYNDAF